MFVPLDLLMHRLPMFWRDCLLASAKTKDHLFVTRHRFLRRRMVRFHSADPRRDTAATRNDRLYWVRGRGRGRGTCVAPSQVRA